MVTEKQEKSNSALKKLKVIFFIIKIVLSVYAVSIMNIFIIFAFNGLDKDGWITIGALVNSTVAATLCTVNIVKDKELSKHHTWITIATVFSISLFALSLVYEHDVFQHFPYPAYYIVTAMLFFYSIYLNYIANKSLEEVVEHSSQLERQIATIDAKEDKYKKFDDSNIDVKL